MAYAQLSGMPPVTGFFAAIMSLFIYPVFGSSGHQAVGPVALLALMTQAALSEVVETSAGSHDASSPAAIADRYNRLAAKLAFLIGVAQMFLGGIRAGYVLNFMSHSVLAGFTASSAIIIGIADYTWVRGDYTFTGIVNATLVAIFGYHLLNAIAKARGNSNA
jgi:SulP family sulfate permease